MSNDMQIFHVLNLLIKSSELVEMRSKEAKCANLWRDVPSSCSTKIVKRMRKGSHSEIAHASPKPSYVDVPEERISEKSNVGMWQYSPRPSSSMMIKESFEADCAILDSEEDTLQSNAPAKSSPSPASLPWTSIRPLADYLQHRHDTKPNQIWEAEPLNRAQKNRSVPSVRWLRPTKRWP